MCIQEGPFGRAMLTVQDQWLFTVSNGQLLLGASSLRLGGESPAC